jgi:acyl carrier protein
MRNATTADLQAFALRVLAEMTSAQQPIAREQLLADLGLDSLDLLELLQAARDEFGVVVSEQEAAQVVTVGDALTTLSAASEVSR